MEKERKKMLIYFLLVTCTLGITAYESHAMDLKCNTICNGKIDRRVCLQNCMASLKNRLEFHAHSNRARKAILTLPKKKKKKKQHNKKRKQNIFKSSKPIKGRRIVRLFNHKKRVH